MKQGVIEPDKADIGLICTFDESSTNAGYIGVFGHIIATNIDLDDISLTPSLQEKANEVIKKERKNGRIQTTSQMTFQHYIQVQLVMSMKTLNQ